MSLIQIIKKYLSVTHILAFYLSVCVSTNITAAEELELIYYGSRDEMALLGFGQGLEDSSNLYQGLKFRLKTETENFRPYDKNEVKALFVSMGTESLRILSLLNKDIPIFNLVDHSDDTRSMCIENVFHILPSESMRDDAVSQWEDSHAVDENKSVEAVAWDSAVDNGKALLLNEKFSIKRSIELSEQGWSGWAAARLFSDAYVTALSEDKDILEVLKNEVDTDLYKGVNAVFRADRQLLQPVYIKEGEKIVGKVPEQGGDTLSELGHTHCE